MDRQTDNFLIRSRKKNLFFDGVIHFLSIFNKTVIIAIGSFPLVLKQ